MKQSFRDYLLDGDDKAQDYYDQKPKFPSWVVRVANIVSNSHDPSDVQLPEPVEMMKAIKYMGTPGDNPDDLAREYIELNRTDRRDRSQELLGFA